MWIKNLKLENKHLMAEKNPYGNIIFTFVNLLQGLRLILVPQPKGIVCPVWIPSHCDPPMV